jgi:hypothetical protein
MEALVEAQAMEFPFDEEEEEEEIIVWTQLKTGGTLDVPEFETKARRVLPMVQDSSSIQASAQDSACREEIPSLDCLVEKSTHSSKDKIAEDLRRSERDLVLEISWLHQAIHDREQVSAIYEKEFQKRKSLKPTLFHPIQFLLGRSRVAPNSSLTT